MDPNPDDDVMSEPVSIVELQVPKIGERIQHGDVVYTVRGVELGAVCKVDVMENERHVLRLKVLAHAGPPKAEDDGGYDDSLVARF